MFTSAEYTTLTLFGILICGSVTAKDLPIKGWIAGFMGVFISLVGIDGLLAQPRFTFGITGLMSGINPIPSMIGFFAIPQIIKQLRNGGERDSQARAGEFHAAGPDHPHAAEKQAPDRKVDFDRLGHRPAARCRRKYCSLACIRKREEFL